MAYGSSQDEIETLYASDAFRINYYKVLPCSKRLSHDWCACPFLHPAEKSRRRSLQEHSYSAVFCTDMRDSGVCPRGDDCPMTHTIFEYWMHPQRYRTLLCKDGTHCNRRVCFFAHSLAELRVPTNEPPPLTSHSQLPSAAPRRTVSNGSSSAASSSTWGSGNLQFTAAAADASGNSTPLVMQRSDLAQHSFDSSQLQLRSGPQVVIDYQSSPLPMLSTGLGSGNYAAQAEQQFGCQLLPQPRQQQNQQQQQLLQETLMRLDSLQIPAPLLDDQYQQQQQQQQQQLQQGVAAPPSPWPQQLPVSAVTMPGVPGAWQEQPQQQQQQPQQAVAPVTTVWHTEISPIALQAQLAAGQIVTPPPTPPGSAAAVSAAVQAASMVVLPVCTMTGWQQQVQLPKQLPQPQPQQQPQQQQQVVYSYVQPSQVVLPAGQIYMLPKGSLLLASQQQMPEPQQ